jgi:hypothetical protein
MEISRVRIMLLASSAIVLFLKGHKRNLMPPKTHQPFLTASLTPS